MAITTFDTLRQSIKPPVAFSKVLGVGTVGQLYSLWNIAGSPGAGGVAGTGAAATPTFTAASTAGIPLTSTFGSQITGQIPFRLDDTVDMLLAQIQFAWGVSSTTPPPHIILCDRLWHAQSSGIAADISSGFDFSYKPIIPARDLNGTTYGTGVLLGLECTTASTWSAPAQTFYSPPAGNMSQIGYLLPRGVTTAALSAGTNAFYPITLPAGFEGAVGGVQNTTDILFYNGGLSTVTGNFVLYREVCHIAPAFNDYDDSSVYSMYTDALRNGLCRMHAGSVPFLLLYYNGGSMTLTGSVGYGNG